MTKLIKITRANDKKHKYIAVFSDGTTTKFGAYGYSDFTKHKDPKRKERYIKRHSVNQDWTDKKKAGTLSRFILWNKPTLEESILDYKKKFNA